MEKPESYRNKWALGLAVTFSVFIFFGWAFYNGYLGFGSSGTMASQKSANQVANVVSSESALSPIQNIKDTFETSFDEINKQYKEFRTSISNVLVPFMTGIEVYKRE